MFEVIKVGLGESGDRLDNFLATFPGKFLGEVTLDRRLQAKVGAMIFFFLQEETSVKGAHRIPNFTGKGHFYMKVSLQLFEGNGFAPQHQPVEHFLFGVANAAGEIVEDIP